MTEPKSDLAYLRNEKTKAEQKLRSCQHREKILERQMLEPVSYTHLTLPTKTE